MFNSRTWKAAKSLDATGCFQAIEETCIRLALRWPRERKIYDLMRTEEVRELQRLIPQLPEEFRPKNLNPISIVFWAHRLASTVAADRLGN